jgi:hypothetical protein
VDAVVAFSMQPSEASVGLLFEGPLGLDIGFAQPILCNARAMSAGIAQVTDLPGKTRRGPAPRAAPRECPEPDKRKPLAALPTRWPRAAPWLSTTPRGPARKARAAWAAGTLQRRAALLRQGIACAWYAACNAPWMKLLRLAANPAPPLETTMSTRVAENSLARTAFARLDAEGRLLNPVLKAATRKPGRVGFRGELALRFAPKLADEARPPELSCDQVIAAAQVGDATLGFFAGYLLNFAHLKEVADVLGDTLGAAGKYFLFCNNIDLSKKYQVVMHGAVFYVLPIDESTVYNELLDLLYLEKNELKKLDTAGKTDRVADAALKFDLGFDTITYAEGLALMGPVRNPNENRPV